MRDMANEQFAAQRFRFALTEFLRGLNEGGPSIAQRVALGNAVREAEILSDEAYARLIEACFEQEGFPLASQDRLKSSLPQTPQLSTALEPQLHLRAGRRYAFR